MQMKTKAQSILEYVLILGIAAAALMLMQLYMRRSIQGVIKVAADELGEQKQGLMEFDYKNDWKVKGSSAIVSVTTGTQNNSLSERGAVRYETEQKSEKSGVSSGGLLWQRQ